jgi:hypothetical protein
MIRLLFAALLLLGAAPAFAQEEGPAGRWALRADGRNLLILELSRTGDRIGFWRGGLRQPRNMRWSGQPDSFLFNVAADGSGALDMPGSGLPPLRLARAGPGEAVADGWDPARTYIADRSWPTNAEMKAIFEADQADRAPGGPAIDWAVVTPRDEARRARTLALVAAGALASGDDYWHAAFVLQHGSAPDDFLLAHTFAIIAAARGRADATWIAAATLDRYLQKSGRPQIYGTQFNTSMETRTTTQDPYDRALISDALRQALGVPPQADLDRRRAEIEASFRARAATPRR